MPDTRKINHAREELRISCAEVAEEIARAKARGVKVTGETCPQHLVLTAGDMARPGREGAKFMCSRSPREGPMPTGSGPRSWPARST